jgi:hypothetical protein
VFEARGFVARDLLAPHDRAPALLTAKRPSFNSFPELVDKRQTCGSARLPRGQWSFSSGK